METEWRLARAARSIATQDIELRWHDWTRYSSRQDSLLKMGGLLGRVTLQGRDLEPFWPYLWLGQWTHAGKGTSMGLGKYRIEPLQPPAAASSETCQNRQACQS